MYYYFRQTPRNPNKQRERKKATNTNQIYNLIKTKVTEAEWQTKKNIINISMMTTTTTTGEINQALIISDLNIKPTSFSLMLTPVYFIDSFQTTYVSLLSVHLSVTLFCSKASYVGQAYVYRFSSNELPSVKLFCFGFWRFFFFLFFWFYKRYKI